MKTEKFLLVFLLAILVITGCAPATNEAPSAPEPATVKGVILPYLSFSPFFIAQEEGFFAEQNIEFEIVELQQSSQAVPQLLQGDIDVNAGLLYPALLNSITQGEAPKLVADKGYLAVDHCTYLGLVQNTSAPVNDFAGARIAFRPGTYPEYYVYHFLQSVGLSFEDIEDVSIPTPAGVGAIADKSIDLVSAGEPWIQRIIQDGGGELMHRSETILPDASLAYIFFSDQFMTERPDVAKRFMTAYLKGVRQYNEDKTERNLDIIAEYTKLDRDLLKKACWPAIHNDGSINVDSIMDYQAWLLMRGLIDKQVEIDQLWDGQFVEAAQEALDGEK